MAVLCSIIVLNFVYGMSSSEPSDNWRIQPGTMLSYTLDTITNTSMHTRIDDISQEYNFDQLDENFWGEPQVDLNITEIDTGVSLSQMVDFFLNFTAPIGINQNLNDTWQPKKSLFFPLVVPIDMWDELESEFEGANTFYCTVEHTSYDEVNFQIGWRDSGQYVYVTFVWSDDDGTLQAIFYEFIDEFDYDTKDILILRLSSIKTQDNSAFFEVFSPTAWVIISISSLILGSAVMVLKIRQRQRFMAERSSQTSSQFDYSQDGTMRQKTEEEFMDSHYENDPQFVEGYYRFKQRYLKRWVFFNALSVGIFFLGIYLLKILGTSSEVEDMIGLVIFGGVAIAGINIYFLSLPLIKFSKKHMLLKTNLPLSTHKQITLTWKNWFKPRISDAQPYFVDPSPILTLVACIMGFIVYSIFTGLDEITTVGGQLVMVALGIVCIAVIIFAYWLYPLVMLQELKKYAIKVNFNWDE